MARKFKVYIVLLPEFNQSNLKGKSPPGRADLVSLLVDLFEKLIEGDEQIFKNHLQSEEDKTLSKPEATKRLFAYGLFSAIAVVQCAFCQPFILEWYDKLKDTQNPFIRGL